MKAIFLLILILLMTVLMFVAVSCRSHVPRYYHRESITPLSIKK